MHSVFATSRDEGVNVLVVVMEKGDGVAMTTVVSAAATYEVAAQRNMEKLRAKEFERTFYPL